MPTSVHTVTRKSKNTSTVKSKESATTLPNGNSTSGNDNVPEPPSTRSKKNNKRGRHAKGKAPGPVTEEKDERERSQGPNDSPPYQSGEILSSGPSLTRIDTSLQEVPLRRSPSQATMSTASENESAVRSLSLGHAQLSHLGLSCVHSLDSVHDFASIEFCTLDEPPGEKASTSMFSHGSHTNNSSFVTEPPTSADEGPSDEDVLLKDTATSPKDVPVGKPCLAFNFGYCRNGKWCKLSHVRVDLQRSDLPAALGITIDPARLSTEVCKPFLTGHCRYGVFCHRVHPNSEAEKENDGSSVVVAKIIETVNMPTPKASTPTLERESKKRVVSTDDKPTGPLKKSSTNVSREETSPQIRVEPGQDTLATSETTKPKSTAPSPAPKEVAPAQKCVSPSGKPVEVCRDYLKGVCPHKNCFRLHPEREQRSPAVSAQEYVSPSGKPVEVCRDYLKGVCRRINCFRLHPEREQRSLAVSAQEYVSPSGKPVEVCRDYLKGFCRNANCFRLHPEREQRSPAVSETITVTPAADLSTSASSLTAQARGLHCEKRGEMITVTPVADLSTSTGSLTAQARGLHSEKRGEICLRSLMGDCHDRNCTRIHPVREQSGLPAPGIIKAPVKAIDGQTTPTVPVNDKVDDGDKNHPSLPYVANLGTPSPFVVKLPNAVKSQGRGRKITRNQPDQPSDKPTGNGNDKGEAKTKADVGLLDSRVETPCPSRPQGVSTPSQPVVVKLPCKASPNNGHVPKQAEPADVSSLPGPSGSDLKADSNSPTVRQGICRPYLRGYCPFHRCKFLHVSPSEPGIAGSTDQQPNGGTNSVATVTKTDRGMPHTQSLPPRFANKDAGVCDIPGLVDRPNGTALAALKTADVPLVPPGNLTKPVTKPDDLPPTNNAVPKRQSEKMTKTVLMSTRVTLGPGFDVLDVTTGFESAWIKLSNVPSGVAEQDVRNLAERFGDVLRVLLPGDERRRIHKFTYVKIQFATPKQAADAVAQLHGATELSSKLEAQLDIYKARYKTGTLDNSTIRIDLPAPGKVAFAGYATLAEAEKVISVVNGSTFRGNTVSAFLHQGLPKLGSHNVKFEGLPPDAMEKELESFGRVEGCMIGRANYQSLDGAIRSIQYLLEESGDMVSFDVAPSAPKDGQVRAWAHFVNASAAAAARSNLNGRRFGFLGMAQIWLDHMHVVTYSVAPDIYASLSRELECFRRYVLHCMHSTIAFLHGAHQRDPTAPIKVRLSSTEIRYVREVKVTLEKMLAGEKLAEGSDVVWDRFFGTPAGYAFIRDVAKATTTCIRVEEMHGWLTLYGAPLARHAARCRIIDQVRTLRAKHAHNVPLTGQQISQLLAGDLHHLNSELGKDNVIVYISQRRLVIRGNNEALQQANRILARGRERQWRNEKPRGSSADCPICFNEVTSAVTLDCGHSSCRSCLARYLATAADHKSFPLTCLGSDATCTERITLSLAKELLTASEIDNLIEAAFRTYIQTRPKEFRYCPSVDCPQIYRAVPDTILQCPSCLIRICPTCYEEDHGGMECMHPSDDDERLFREWRAANDVKSCPGCRADIEKAAGCNHMTCSRCQTHICWVCMATFKGGDGIYDHMRVMHGGIGI